MVANLAARLILSSGYPAKSFHSTFLWILKNTFGVISLKCRDGNAMRNRPTTLSLCRAKHRLLRPTDNEPPHTPEHTLRKKPKRAMEFLFLGKRCQKLDTSKRKGQNDWQHEKKGNCTRSRREPKDECLFVARGIYRVVPALLFFLSNDYSCNRLTQRSGTKPKLSKGLFFENSKGENWPERRKAASR